MNKIILKSVSAAIMTLSIAPFAHALSGDTKLACEAILCLSSGTRPSECTPSLRKFFSIWDKKPWKIPQKRLNFLNLCPVVGAGAAASGIAVLESVGGNDANEIQNLLNSSQKAMPELLNAIAHGAGYCDAAHLNKHNTERRTHTRWKYVNHDFGCTTEEITYYVISDKKPNYCQVYEDHAFTHEIETKYIGTPETGGKWAEAKDYARALQEYNDNKKPASYYLPEDDSRCRSDRGRSGSSLWNSWNNDRGSR
ncbi:TrbM/KikA/MpfK family conjugal transfer protein [Oligella urethralis]|uniref:Conjugal transfer protein TrbM n=1 Tax=Oligella urethralis TaxID=90245 RepID=A0A2X1WIQ5_9BURK|nr:TrbM/KikA/MpfK family conjugal transfer protein [Oligella urethralis]SPY08454.1 conjugal transfer protein TrbM [Oligella urethralis]